MISGADFETSWYQKGRTDLESAHKDNFRPPKLPLSGIQSFFARIIGKTLTFLGTDFHNLRVGLTISHRAFDFWREKSSSLDLRIVCITSINLSAKLVSKKVELRLVVKEFIRIYSVDLKE